MWQPRCFRASTKVHQGGRSRRSIAKHSTPLKLTTNNPSRLPSRGLQTDGSECVLLSTSSPLPSPASLLQSNLRCSPCFMAASISATGLKALPSTFHGSWTTSLAGEDRAALTKSVPTYVRVARPPRSRPRMGNVNEGKGLFAPLVVLTRNIIGRKRFNQLRGRAIALHSQVITEFCKTIGADNKQRQGLIRLAKKNGEKLGFLA